LAAAEQEAARAEHEREKARAEEERERAETERIGRRQKLDEALEDVNAKCRRELAAIAAECGDLERRIADLTARSEQLLRENHATHEQARTTAAERDEMQPKALPVPARQLEALRVVTNRGDKPAWEIERLVVCAFNPNYNGVVPESAECDKAGFDVEARIAARLDGTYAAKAREVHNNANATAASAVANRKQKAAEDRARTLRARASRGPGWHVDSLEEARVAAEMGIP
jgi:hypothetical protein